MEDDFDLTADDNPVAAHAMYAQLREECPVAYSSAYGGFYALTRYDDVKAAAMDPATFISSVRAVVPSDPRGLRRPPLNFDAPAHTPFRRALERTLQRSRLERLEPALSEHARRALRPLLETGEGDIATGFGVQFPAWVTTEWLNLEPHIAPHLADTSFAWITAWREQDGETTTAMSERMYDIARDLVRRRREEPLPVEEDPASSLLAERIDGEPLTDEHLVGCLRQSLVVGMVAPPILLGSTLRHLSEDTDLQDRLRRDPALIPAAIEEFLRLYAPYRGFARTASKPTDVRGRTIPVGVPVTLPYAAANRDPRVFADPDTFILGRENVAKHLGFGRGPHRCVGMPLARMAIRIALEELLAATDFFSTHGPYTYARMPEVGLTSVPVTVRASGSIHGASRAPDFPLEDASR
ncbi:cytochrome P450 [Paramicrobacterium fandaimingii]|uniref:cytochrome P450 n=1 Tax=Paramicrobacterium fandaimingii TaxID=2708079 RepID=UPI001F1A4CCF|nr:cytochrome P450 [Microbacterium fandaimingii]